MARAARQPATGCSCCAADAPIQTAFAHLAQDPPWTKMIAAAIREQFGQGRKVPVLTERTDHLENMQSTLNKAVEPLFVLHVRLAKKARAAQLAALDALSDDVPRVVLATGRLVGEGLTGLAENAQKRDIECAFTQLITRFRLELGAGFAFVGRQYRLDVGGDCLSSFWFSTISTCVAMSSSNLKRRRSSPNMRAS
ncbi:hypothetical protein OKW41_004578 [Paraburkholderia sp. UCT70]